MAADAGPWRRGLLFASASVTDLQPAIRTHRIGLRGLIRREAIEQAVSSSASQIVLAATAVRPTGGMRRIP